MEFTRVSPRDSAPSWSPRSTAAWHSMQRGADGTAERRFGLIADSQSMQVPKSCRCESAVARLLPEAEGGTHGPRFGSPDPFRRILNFIHIGRRSSDGDAIPFRNTRSRSASLPLEGSLGIRPCCRCFLQCHFLRRLSRPSCREHGILGPSAAMVEKIILKPVL